MQPRDSSRVGRSMKCMSGFKLEHIDIVIPISDVSVMLERDEKDVSFCERTHEWLTGSRECAGN